MNFERLFNQSYLILENWQWVGVLSLILVGFVAANLVGFLINHALRKKWRIYFEQLDSRVQSTYLVKPVSMFVLGWVWLIGIRFIQLPDEFNSMVIPGTKVLSYYGLVWGIWRLAELLGFMMVEKASQTETKFDDLLAPIVKRSIRVLAIIIGILSISEILKLPLSSLIAGLGIGGIAIAMAAKDTIANVFGSITILMDRPFNIGDSVVIGSTEGTVEQVGFRSTRVRTYYNSLVSVPNANLLTAVVDNLGERKFRRFRFTLGLVYATSAEQIEAFCEGIRELIRLHPDTRKDQFYVGFQEFGDFSLNILVHCFFNFNDFSLEVKAKHSLLLDIKRLATQLGVDFAFPTQSVVIEKEPASSTTLASRDTISSAQDSAKRLAESISTTYKGSSL